MYSTCVSKALSSVVNVRVLRWLGCPMATGGDAKGGRGQRIELGIHSGIEPSTLFLFQHTHPPTHPGRKERRKKRERERRVGKKEGESGYNVTSRGISRVTNGVGETPAAS